MFLSWMTSDRSARPVQPSRSSAERRPSLWPPPKRRYAGGLGTFGNRHFADGFEAAANERGGTAETGARPSSRDRRGGARGSQEKGRQTPARRRRAPRDDRRAGGALAGNGAPAEPEMGSAATS